MPDAFTAKDAKSAKNTIHSLAFLAVSSFLVLFSSHSLPAYDLSQVKIEKLQNGLTVMMLEDHTQPLVSTQVLYKVGARNECVGVTGIAHFLEHMSFRATKNFPNTDVVSRIYAIGGEWHGYTWIDETTYYETVPREDLELTLRIQADRMSNTLIKEDEVDAERGVVLTELHSYENDPAFVLNDAVVAASFAQHPYRYNTLGWKSDVQKITHADLVSFYHRYYNPSNAVLAIAGDFKPQQLMSQIHQYFDPIPGGESSTMPRTVEPSQQGERRITLQGPSPLNYFEIMYRAPAAKDPDFPILLVLQAILGGSAGVNFIQKEEPELAHPGTRLYGVADQLGTYLAASADPYMFMISGRTDPSTNTTTLEQAVESKIAELRNTPVTHEELERAKGQLLAALVYDIETTEEAADQMAYFQGIDAFPVIQQLPELLSRVTPEHVQDLARRYLQPRRRTIGWYRGGDTTEETAEESPAPPKPAAPPPAMAAEPPHPQDAAPSVLKLKNGTLIARGIGRTPAGFLRAVLTTNTVEVNVEFTPDDPAWGTVSVNKKFLKGELESTITALQTAVNSPGQAPASDSSEMEDPEFRLNQTMQEMLGVQKRATVSAPWVVVVVGDLNEPETLAALKKAFSDVQPVSVAAPASLAIQEKSQVVSLPGKPQSEFGYFFVASKPSDPASYAYRILLYIMAHGYEGRLGKELIGKTGLIYYIDSNYNSNGQVGWISLTFGVDPDKLETSKQTFFHILNDLKEHPPTAAEVEEAKEYLIGRRRTAYQSNEELSAFYAREWIEQGRLLSDAEFEKRVRSVTLDQVLKIVPKFLNGSTAIIDTN